MLQSMGSQSRTQLSEWNLGLLRQHALEPVLCNKRKYGKRSPHIATKSSPYCCNWREHMCSHGGPVQPRIN